VRRTPKQTDSDVIIVPDCAIKGKIAQMDRKIIGVEKTGFERKQFTWVFCFLNPFFLFFFEKTQVFVLFSEKNAKTLF